MDLLGLYGDLLAAGGTGYSVALTVEFVHAVLRKAFAAQCALISC